MSFEIAEFDSKFLASLMNNIGAISALGKEVSVYDFSDPLYYEIYSAIVEFYIDKKEPSYSDLKFRFRDDSVIVAVIEYISEIKELINDLPIVYEAMCENSRKLQLKALGKFISSNVSACDTKDLMSRVEDKLAKINLNSNSKIEGTGSIDGEYIVQLKERSQKLRSTGNIIDALDLPTGFETIDRATLGLTRSGTWVIGAETSDGKTQAAIQITSSILEKGYCVYYFLLEDTKKKLLTRYASLQTGIPISKILIGDVSDAQITQIQSVLTKLRMDYSLLMEDELTDVNDIITKIRFAKFKHPNLSLVVFDNINIAYDRLNKNNREAEISGISKKLISVAKSSDLNVIILQQLNTNPDARTTGLPVRMNDLRDSKAPGHDADVTILLHCPDKYTADKAYSRKWTQAWIVKNRSGEPHKVVDLTSHGHIARFTEGKP